jgi:amino acid adenylation domain-containing protein
MTTQVNSSEAVSFNPGDLEDLYQLSPMQLGMLFHSIYAPGSGVFVSQSLFNISGKLDVAAFERAWQRVVERHAILRTSFLWEELEAPVQAVQRRISLPIEKQDWRDLDAGEQAKRLAGYFAADGKHEFDLTRAPLLRLALFQLADDAYKFLLSAHHILLDRWSRSVVQKEVFAFYKAFSRGEELHLERPRPYGEFIAWLGQQDKKTAETYWRSRLKGFSAPTSLVFDRRPADLAEENRHYDTERFQLSVQETDQLKALAREHKLTLNTFIQGVWSLLLSRYSSEEDVLFGVTVLGRPPSLRGVESMVGLFINTLPLRVQVPPEGAVWPWLKYLQEQQVSLQQYEHSSLIDIQGWSEIPRGLPLFNSFVVFENIPVSNTFQTDDGGLKIEHELGMSSTGYPLAVLAFPGSNLRIGLTYDLARFEAEHVRQMAGHFRNLFRAIIADPKRKLSQLPLLTREEQRRILEQWNKTDTEYEKDSCIHQLFERQASRTPHAVAVQSEDQQLTYVELNDRSNRLAHYLRKRGVGHETRVAICVERSLEMMVGLLSILKAGAAYVPLDPAFPKERLAFMIADANVPVLLTQQHLRSALPSHQATVIALDSDWEMIARESAAEPTNGSTPEDLAYVIYTSGSTGKPKGVEISHRALTNFLCSVRQEPGLMAQDVMLSVTTLSFDIAALELYLPLITGARLVVVSRETAVDGNLLKEALVQSRATVVQATPATWKMLIDAGWTGNKQLKVLCGGDALSRELANRLFELVGSLWNMYGPTETTIWSTTCKIESTSGPVSIGRPLANTQVYLLDVALNPVPVGIVGELHIGGDGLARGYLNRPELTAQKFIPHPFSNDPDKRIYKTGDLARYLPDGTIECLGRNDDQVKIRGFRIELGEIESVLRQHPSVRESVVVAQQDISSQRQLVAYIVPLANEEIDQRSLRTLLQSKLPDYMIPSVLVELAALPLTPNGKIDRRALPPPDRTRPPLRETHIAPRDDLERGLAQIWKKVLGLDSVGVRDNFFDSGGHSLLAVRLVSEIEKEFSQRIPLVSLFQKATIEHLADILRRGVRSISWPVLVEIQTGSSRPPLFCVSAPNVNALGYRSLAHYLGPDQPVYGLQAQYPEDLQGEHSQRAIDELATEYLAAIRKVQPAGPYLFVGMCRGAHIAYEIARRLEQDSQRVTLVGILDTWVLENTYNWFLYVDYYARRFKTWLQLSRKDQLNLIRKKVRWGATSRHDDATTPSSGNLPRRLANPMSAYFPGPDFKPKTYGGRVSVFRTRRQPLNRVRDKELGWGKLAAGGVDLHYVSGRHGSPLLREPNVRGLAAELKQCLMDAGQ